jgi:cation:H+ antiporter
VPLLLFLIGVILLLKAADLTVESAEGLALRHNIPSAIIGLTVVAFGTSLPELVVTTDAILSGDYAIGIGNIIGSNIANIGLILGIMAMLRPDTCCIIPSRRFLLKNGLFVVGATLLFALFAVRGIFDVYAGVILLATFGAFLFLMGRSGYQDIRVGEKNLQRPLLFTIIGIAGVILGAHLLVLGAVEIAGTLGIPQFFIGISLVAVGTSLPEMATSLAASARKNTGIAIGNIFGSNVFNLLFVGGINALFTPIPFSNLLSIAVLIAFTLGLFPLFTGRISVTRSWGIVLLLSYLLSVALLFVL